MSDSGGDRDPVEVLAEEFLARKRRGEKPSLSEYAENHPELAAEIRDLFPALVMMEDVGQQSLASTGPDLGGKATRVLRELGEYRILREVGRGGMGVVYEAEQQSLGRRVALKVLPPHVLNDAQRLQRFDREARAAAKLHHTNIVPVFGVGHQDDTHYYVMQFIQGLGLDGVLEELRTLRAAPHSPKCHEPHQAHPQVQQVAHSLMTGDFAGDNCQASSTTIPSAASDSAVPRLPDGSDLSSVSGDDARYWRSVARIGVQVADALEYAHGQGILHRDIKPSNLLMDLKGTVWVTDFGLAKSGDSEELTHTGDVVGTLRYMAPERFEGRSDARSDVYSLGLTLYELLALRPAFDQRDRAKLMQQVAHEEPPRLRKLNRAIPRDLETIVQKAMAKEPEQRYARASDLAADLKRFLDDRPIQARRVGGTERLWRWCRRNPLPAGLAAAVAVLLMVASVVSGVLAVRANDNADRADAKAADANKEAARADKEAGLAKDRADSEAKARKQADEALKETRHTLAVSNFRRAVAELENNHVPLARERLLAIPPEERGWEWRYLRRLCEGSLFTLRGHTDPVRQATYSPNGLLIASSSFGVWDANKGRNVLQQIKVWDARTGQELYTLEGNKAPTYHAAFSPDGKSLAAPCRDGVVRIWDAATGRMLRSISPAAEPTTPVVFSPDGRRIAAGCMDKTIRLWDMDGEQVVQLERHAEVPLQVMFSPDGLRLASQAQRNERLPSGETKQAGEWKVWDLKSQRTVIDHAKDVVASAAAFAPDGKRFTTVDNAGLIAIWDTESGRIVTSTRLQHGTRLMIRGLSPDGQLVVTYDSLGHVLVWDAATGRSLYTFSGHTNDLAGITAVAFSPDGAYLATGAFDALRVWDLRSGKEALALRGQNGPSCLAFSPDGQQLVSGSTDWTVKVWDAHNQPGSYSIWQFTAGLAFSQDGQLMALENNNGLTLRVSMVDLSSGKTCYSLERQRPFGARVALSADGKYLAFTSKSGTVVCDAPTGKKIASLDYPVDQLAPTLKIGNNKPDPLAKEVNCLAFIPDGRRLVTGSWSGLGDDKVIGEVSIWDIESGRVVLTLRGQVQSQVTNRLESYGIGASSVAVSPDGKTVAFSENNLVEVCDLESRASLFTLRDHRKPVTSLAFSPDGRWLASGSSEENTVLMWDARSGKQQWALRKDSSLGMCVSFCKDSQRLVSSGRTTYWGKSLTIYDVATGLELINVDADPGPHEGIAAFSPDGKRLVAKRWGQVQIWEAPDLVEPVIVDLPRLDQATCVAFSADGQRLAYATTNGPLRILDARTGQEVQVLERLDKNSFVAVAFPPDGKRLATSNGRTQIWDLKTGKLLHDGLAASGTLAFSRDGALLACVGNRFDGKAWVWEAHVWDSLTGKELHTFNTDGGRLKALAFNKDGTRLLTLNESAERAAWDFRSGQKLAGETEDADLPLDPHISPDHKRIVRVSYLADSLTLEELTPPTAEEQAWRRLRTAWDEGWHEEQARGLRSKADLHGEQKSPRGWNAILWHVDLLLTVRPDDLSLRERRGHVLVELGRLTEARAELARRTQLIADKPGLNPPHEEARVWYLLALTQLADGQTEAYRQTCAEVLRRYGRPTGETQLRLALAATPDNVAGLFSVAAAQGHGLDHFAWSGTMTAHTCALQPGAVADPTVLLPLAGDDESLRGRVLCRAGKPADAVRLFQAVVARYRASRQQPPVEALLYLAIAEKAQGRTEAARQALNEATQWLDRQANLGPTSDPVIVNPSLTNADAGQWFQRLERQLLRREAEAMLKAEKP
jgi:WD40 repeat protein/serine/threonine protein kinase